MDAKKATGWNVRKCKKAHKNLLLESSLSIKEIASRVGYIQQHEFNRMFHRFAGMAPSHWRNNPWARSTESRPFPSGEEIGWENMWHDKIPAS